MSRAARDGHDLAIAGSAVEMHVIDGEILDRFGQFLGSLKAHEIGFLVRFDLREAQFLEKDTVAPRPTMTGAFAILAVFRNSRSALPTRSAVDGVNGSGCVQVTAWVTCTPRRADRHRARGIDLDPNQG